VLGLASHLEQHGFEFAGLGGAEAVVLTIHADRVPEVPSLVDLLSLIEPNMHLERDAVAVGVLGRHDDVRSFVPEVIHPVQQPVLQMPIASDAPRWAVLVVAPAVVV